MSAPEQPAPNQEGTWLEGRDILPPNIPPQPSQAPGAPPAAPQAPAPRRRPRRWSLIVGLPLLILICLVVGAVAGQVIRGTALGSAGAGSAGTGDIRTVSGIGGDPLLSARVESAPEVPKAPVLYLEAQAKGDGQAAWNQLSNIAQQQLARQGGSADALTQELKQNPLPPLKQITFVGGSTMGDGREATIFVVTADVNGALRQVPYYFTVDTQGKIDEVH